MERRDIRRGLDGVGRNPFRPPRRGEREVISGAIYPAFKPSARGVTPPNDRLGLEDGCGSGNEEKEQDQMSKSIRTWSMREEGRKGEGGAVLERHARVGKEQLSVTTGAFETYGSLLSSFLHYQRSLNSLLLPYIRAFASHILYDLAALRTSVWLLKS